MNRRPDRVAALEARTPEPSRWDVSNVPLPILEKLAVLDVDALPDASIVLTPLELIILRDTLVCH